MSVKGFNEYNCVFLRSGIQNLIFLNIEEKRLCVLKLI